MEPLDELVRYFKKLPSVGSKTAQRMAFFVLSQSTNWVDSFAETLKTVKAQIKYCSQCYNLTLNDPCPICASGKRERQQLCVVADPKDLMAIEKTNEYHGLYHILGGVISPIDGITPELLKIQELIKRVERGGFKEIFFAINPTVEGEATMLYITKLLRGFPVKLTRIAYGLPIGSDLDYADELTISKALQGRVEI